MSDKDRALWVCAVMAQAQTFASAWALVGSRFDSGSELVNAEAMRAELLQMVAAGPSVAPGFDLLKHLQRQSDFSARTFGPGSRVAGVTDHIAKELIEVRESGGDLAEWVDVIILAFDGAWRSGASPAQIIDHLVAKQTRNEDRTWPDWRTADLSKAIEHDRSGEDAGADSAT